MAGSTPIDFVIGFLVSLGASTLNALGLNLLKLDHVRNSKKIDIQQRHDCGRPMWHFGLYLYIASQLIGSTIALSKFRDLELDREGSITKYQLTCIVSILRYIFVSLDYLKTQV
jgi:hypothetical protein